MTDPTIAQQVAALVDGRLDTTARAELDAAICGDPRVRQAVRDELRFHWQVGTALQLHAGMLDAQPARSTGRPWMLPTLGFLVLALGLALTLLWWPTPAPPAAPAWHLHQGGFADPPLAIGAELPSGRQLTTAVGMMAGLGPPSGSTVLVGPNARVMALPGGCQLLDGRILLGPGPWQVQLGDELFQGAGRAEAVATPWDWQMLAHDPVQRPGALLGPHERLTAAGQQSPWPSATVAAYGAELYPAVAAHYRSGKGFLLDEPGWGPGALRGRLTADQLQARATSFLPHQTPPRSVDGWLRYPTAGAQAQQIYIPLLDGGDAWVLDTRYQLGNSDQGTYTFTFGPSWKPEDPDGQLSPIEQVRVSDPRSGPIPLQIRFRRIGRFGPDALFELGVVVDGVPHSQGWVLGYPSTIAISHRNSDFRLGAVTVSELREGR